MLNTYKCFNLLIVLKTSAYTQVLMVTSTYGLFKSFLRSRKNIWKTWTSCPFIARRVKIMHMGWKVEMRSGESKYSSFKRLR
jgi:hypothetical protein